MRRAIRAAGAHLFFLPKYSPDLNPIEQFFAKLKLWLRKAARRTTEAVYNAIGPILDTVSAAECANIPPQLGYHKRHALGHEPRYKGHIPRKAIQLGDYNAALGLAGCYKGGGELWPAVQGIGALARFRLRVFADDGQVLRCREALDGRPLGFYAETRALLSLGRNSKIPLALALVANTVFGCGQS